MEVIQGARLPIFSWATDVEDETLRQARDLGDLEVAVDHAALMPDAHSRFGMPIGGVLVTDGADCGHSGSSRADGRGSSLRPAEPLQRPGRASGTVVPGR